MGGDEKSVQENRRKESRDFTRNYIELLYDSLLELGYLYKDMYDMTLYELEHTIEYARKGLAYRIWRLSTFVHSPLVKEFPDSPKKAMPELYPQERGIPMPSFLKEKAMKRGVM